MPEPELVESVDESFKVPVKPFTNLLIGIAIPLAAMAAFAAAGAGLAVIFAGAGRAAVQAAAAVGALLGFLASFYGIAELLIAAFLSGGPGINRLCRAAGYIAVWAAAAGVLLWLRQ